MFERTDQVLHREPTLESVSTRYKLGTNLFSANLPLGLTFMFLFTDTKLNNRTTSVYSPAIGSNSPVSSSRYIFVGVLSETGRTARSFIFHRLRQFFRMWNTAEHLYYCKEFSCLRTLLWQYFLIYSRILSQLFWVTVAFCPTPLTHTSASTVATSQNGIFVICLESWSYSYSTFWRLLLLLFGFLFKGLFFKKKKIGLIT